MDNTRNLSPREERDVDQLIANYGVKPPEPVREQLKMELAALKGRFVSREEVLTRAKELEQEHERNPERSR